MACGGVGAAAEAPARASPDSKWSQLVRRRSHALPLRTRTDRRGIGSRRTIGGDEIAKTIHRTLGQRPISATHCRTPSFLWRRFSRGAFCCFPPHRFSRLARLTVRRRPSPTCCGSFFPLSHDRRLFCRVHAIWCPVLYPAEARRMYLNVLLIRPMRRHSDTSVRAPCQRQA